MKKQVWSIMLAICLLLTILPTPAAAADEPVQISDGAELAAAIDADPAGSYILTADITLTEAWTPLPIQTDPDGPFFTGTLDGDGHVIRGLKIALDEYDGPAGLIANLAGGTIKNLGVELAADGVSGGYWVGGLVGTMDGGTIENCYVTGSVSQTGSADDENTTAGGLVGYLTDGTISRCYTEGAVSGSQQVGGLVGCMEGGDVADCYSWSGVTGEDVAGGLVGEMDGGSLTRCYYAKGSVTGDPSADSVGIVIGWRTDGTTEECYYETTENQEAIGSDDTFMFPAPESTPALTSGSPLSSSWDAAIWRFVQGEYPVFQRGEPPADTPLDSPQNPVCQARQYTSGSDWLYEVSFPAVDNATGYSVQIYGEDDQPVGDPVIWQDLSPLSRAAVRTIAVKLNDAIDAAALLQLEINPDKTTFQFTCGVTALGSAGQYTNSTESVRAALPELYLLTSIADTPLPSQRHPAGTSYEDEIRPTLPATAMAVADGQSVTLDLKWPPLNIVQQQLSVVTVEARFHLPENVINPKDLGVSVRLVFFTKHAAPSNLAWDAAVPGKATWTNTENTGSVSVQLLKDGAPVGDWEQIGKAWPQEYDFTRLIREAGSGSYTFQAKVNSSIDPDQLCMESDVAVVSTAYQYQFVPYSVIFDAQGGASVPAAGGLAYGATVTPPVPIRTGYTFGGWFTAPDGVGTAFTAHTPVTDDLTVYAQWTANPYTIAFDPNGGTGAMSSLLCTFGQAKDLSANTFIREGHTFQGWSLTPGGVVRYGNGQSVVDLTTEAEAVVTLYAVWSQAPVYNISGTVVDSGGRPVNGAEVILKRGVTVWASTTTDAQGAYTIENVPDGAYNLVAKHGGQTMTVLVTVSGADVNLAVITMPSDKVNSVLEVHGADTPAVVVGGLEQEAVANAELGKSITVTMTVAAQDWATADPQARKQQEQIEAQAQGRTLEFLALTVTRETRDGGGATRTDTLSELNTVLELVIPFDASGKQDVTVYRCHDGRAEALEILTARPSRLYRDGTFFLDNGLLYVYAQKYSTYAIGYTVPAPPPPPPEPSGGSSSTTYYTLTATAGVGGAIDPVGKISVAHKGSRTFTVIPDTGYTIRDVLVDGESVGAVKSYTFEKVTKSHTIEVHFQEEDKRSGWNPFEDVREGDWFYDSVKYVYENDLMIGTSPSRFSPEWDTSRGMIVTILWRMEQEPMSSAVMAFGDVKADSYCYAAVRWAATYGIVKGYDAVTFGPDNTITRQELAAILYRYSQYKGYDVSASDDLTAFSDRPDPWAEGATKWAVGAGLLGGKGNGILDPRGEATRAEAAAILTRYLRRIEE